MRAFEKPSIEVVLLRTENILSTSCPTFNCTNPLGYGDLCAGAQGHDYCGSETGYTPSCPNDDLP